MTVPIGSVLPGPIRQIGYVVRDLEAAIDAALALGIGPWFTIRDMPQEGVVHRGEPCRPVLSVGFANSGDLILGHGTLFHKAHQITRYYYIQRILVLCQSA